MSGHGPGLAARSRDSGGRDDGGDRDERWYLTDERDFLRRSLDDADRELAAGDLSEEDHALLTARDAARLVDVEATLATLGPEAPPDDASMTATGHTESSGRRAFPLWRRVGVVVACLLIVTGVTVLVVHSTQGRQPGQFSSGSITLSQAQLITQQLSQALTLNNQGNEEGSLELYDKVLGEDPSNPAALAYAGYIQWNVGSSAHVASLVEIGRAEVKKAVAGSPSYFQAHLFLGLILENQDHNDVGAVTQFDDFLADGPPTAELAQVAPLVDGAYQAAGDPVPSALASGSTSTSTSTSTSAP